MVIVLIKLLIAVGLVSLILVAEALRPRIVRVSLLRSAWSVWLLLGILRLLPYLVVYLVIGLEARSDVVSYFWPQAVHAARGEIVYRDFASHYAPLFPYVLSIVIRLWQDPRAIVLFMVVVEVLTLLGTYAVFSGSMDRDNRVYAALIYLLSPAPFILILLGGQEDVWLWTFGVLIAWLLVRRKSFAAGLLAGFGLLVTKALFVLAVIPTFFATRRPLVYLFGLAVVGLLAFPPLWFLAGSSIFMPLQESTSVSPPNLWFAANAVMGGVIPMGSPGLAAVSLCIVFVLGTTFFWAHRRVVGSLPEGYAAGWVFLFNMLMLLSPKSLGNYVAIFLMPLTFLVVLHRDQRAMRLLLALNVFAAIQPSLWYRLGSPSHIGFSFLGNPLELAEFVMELGMIAVFIALLHRCWVWISMSAEGASRVPRLSSLQATQREVR